MIDLGTPKSIAVSSATNELLNQIDESISEFNTLRPLDRDTETRIKMAFLPDRVTASLNMEGIVATRRQTLAVLDAMTIRENSTKTEQEILNALEADEHTLDTSRNKLPLTETFIREINGLIERNIGESPGCYRHRDLQISGADFTPPPHYDIPHLMTTLVDTYNRSEFSHAVVGSVWLHNRFTYIHPFLDGNGRTGRLLQDYCLLSGDLFPTGIPTSKRDDYYDSLALADNGDWDALIQIVALRELEVIAKASAVANERKERSKWIKALAKRASEKKTGALYKQYLVWSHRMGELRAAFEVSAKELNEASDIVRVDHVNYDLVDFPTWKEIRERGHSTRTWFFSQTFRIESEAALKYIFNFRRHKSLGSDIFPRRDDIVSLFITGGKPEDTFDFRGGFFETEIDLREIVFVGDSAFKIGAFAEYDQEMRGHPRVSTKCDAVSEVGMIVRSFFEDILVKKVGL